MLIFQSSRPLKLITSLGLALSIALLGACSSSDPTKETLCYRVICLVFRVIFLTIPNAILT
jgi:hypothetical protein